MGTFDWQVAELTSIQMECEGEWQSQMGLLISGWRRDVPSLCKSFSQEHPCVMPGSALSVLLAPTAHDCMGMAAWNSRSVVHLLHSVKKLLCYGPPRQRMRTATRIRRGVCTNLKCQRNICGAVCERKLHHRDRHWRPRSQLTEPLPKSSTRG